MPLCLILHTGVPLISEVPVTTQDDKSGKANVLSWYSRLNADCTAINVSVTL